MSLCALRLQTTDPDAPLDMGSLGTSEGFEIISSGSTSLSPFDLDGTSQMGESVEATINSEGDLQVGLTLLPELIGPIT